MNVEDHPSAPRPWHQFSLRTLLIAIAAWGAACALVAATGARGAAVLVSVVAVVALHLLGNAWGRRAARNRARDPAALHSAPPDDVAPPPDHVVVGSRAPDASDFAPPTRLRGSSGPGHWMFYITPCGGALGAALGSWCLFREFDSPIEWTGYFVGTLSATTVGAFLSYLITTCLQTALEALHEAASPEGEASGRRKRESGSRA